MSRFARVLADARVIARGRVLEVTSTIRSGHPAEEIVRHAEASGAGLIVIGHRGHFLRRFPPRVHRREGHPPRPLPSARRALSGTGRAEAPGRRLAAMPSGADGPPGRPVRLRASLPLPVARETAWRIWSVVEDWPRWDGMRSRDARWLAGPPWTVGARLRIGRWPGRFDCELVEVDPPRCVTWVGDFAGIRGRHSFGFLPHAGGCLMVSDETFSGRGAGLLAPVIRWAWSRQMGAFSEWARSGGGHPRGRGPGARGAAGCGRR